MRTIVFVAASPAVDRFHLVDRVVPGEIHRPSTVTVVAGGKALNGARAAHSLVAGSEVHVRVAGLVGGHSGRWIADAIAAETIPAHWTWSKQETRTCVVIGEGESASRSLTEIGPSPVGERRTTDFYEPASIPTSSEWAAFCGVVREASADATWVALAGSLRTHDGAGDVETLMMSARANNASIAVDTSGTALATAIDCHPDLVKVNASEAAEVLGAAPPRDRRALVSLASALSSRAGHKGALVVTAGQLGACMVSNPSAEHLWAWWGSSPTVGSFPTGCGDSFLAGMLATLSLRPGEWEEALRAGLGAAGASAEAMGTGLLDPDRARSLTRATQIEAVDLNCPKW